MTSTEITELADELTRLEALSNVLHLALRAIEAEDVTFTEIAAISEISGDVASISTELRGAARRMSFVAKKKDMIQ